MPGANNIIWGFTGPWGVKVEIDSSLLLLIGLLVYLSLPGGLTDGLVLAAVLVGSILLHEFGHAWGSIVQGIPVTRVVLHGGGGFCQSARHGSRAERELVVAMGPLVNLALWALSGIAIWGLVSLGMAMGPAGAGWFSTIMYAIGLLELVAWINLALFLFNLIPVQPLDGGKLLFLALARLRPADQAMRLTGAIGYVLSILWIPGMIGIFFLTGWVLFFFPSIRAHKALMEGRRLA